MKITITLGLDLDTLPMEEHEKDLLAIQTTVATFYSDRGHSGLFRTRRKVVNATGFIEVDFGPGRVVPDLHIFGCFLPRFDTYRWINISKEA